MILRRVIQHVKKQEWTAIWIDLVIVVLGVFIGIQVANWNEERVERALVRGHLSEIAIDLRMHQAVSNEIELSTRQRISAVDYIQLHAFGTPLPTSLMLAGRHWQAPPATPFPPDQYDQLLSSVNLTRVSVRSRNGYESLINSGRLGLVRNRALARQLQAYYGNYDDMLDTQANVFRPFRNQGVQIQYALGLSVFDRRPAAEIVALAKANPSFAAYLRTQREWGILNYNLVRDIDRETAILLAAIEKELAQP